MCFPQRPAGECSSFDVFDLFINESEREETENALRHINQAFNQVFEEHQTNQRDEINNQFFEEQFS